MHLNAKKGRQEDAEGKRANAKNCKKGGNAIAKKEASQTQNKGQ
jgi:hypothetical protein